MKSMSADWKAPRVYRLAHAPPLSTALMPCRRKASPTATATAPRPDRSVILTGACRSGAAGGGGRAPGPGGRARAPQDLPQRSGGKVARVQLEDTCPAQGPADHEAVQFQAAERPLDAGEGHFEEPRELPGIALAQKAQRQQDPGAPLSSERARRRLDHNLVSYDHIKWSTVKGAAERADTAGLRARARAAA